MPRANRLITNDSLSQRIVTCLGIAIVTTLLLTNGDNDSRAAEPSIAVGPSGASDTRTPKFELDVLPILTATGCNSGACHGKARGQNGFALSLLGFDADFDYDAMVHQARGRRLFPASPEQSLLLKKGAAIVPHGGGVRLQPDGEDYQLILRWISAGAPRVNEHDPKLERIAISPEPHSLQGGARESLQVLAPLFRWYTTERNQHLRLSIE
jgi:hypothetical protein